MVATTALSAAKNVEYTIPPTKVAAIALNLELADTYVRMVMWDSGTLYTLFVACTQDGGIASLYKPCLHGYFVCLY